MNGLKEETYVAFVTNKLSINEQISFIDMVVVDFYVPPVEQIVSITWRLAVLLAAITFNGLFAVIWDTWLSNNTTFTGIANGILRF